jgi:YbbR domain-containing protein
MSQLNRTNITVKVDLTDVRGTGPIDKGYTVSYPPGVAAGSVNILKRSPEYITVSIDRLSSKTVEVRGALVGSVEPGYMAEPMAFSPETLVVSGPEEAISQVDYAWVELRRENLNKTVIAPLEFTLMTAEGEPVDTKEISVDATEVSVTLPIVMVKEVTLTLEIKEGGGANRDHMLASITPRTITLSGSPEILNGINQITLGTVDLSKFVSSYTETFPIPLPNGVTNLSGETEATAEISIEGLDTKRVIATNIELINVAAGHTATPVTQYLEVIIRGPREAVELVNAFNLRVVVDLAELRTKGRSVVESRVYVDGYSAVGVVGAYRVVVSLDEEPPPDASPSPSPTPSPPE